MVEQSELDAVDRYLSNDSKVLDGFQPHWSQHPGYKDHQIGWLILEEDTGIIRSKLQFRIPDMYPQYCSISLIFKGNAVCRADKDASHVCKANPPFASKFALPAKVCGPHLHGWHDNKGYIATSHRWDLPLRRQIEQNIDSIDNMFF